MEKLLESVRDFADKAHGSQMRKYAPERYIEHPLRVMKTCSGYTADKTILAAAILHDVAEDTDTTQNDILDFLAGLMDKEDVLKTARLVEELTDVYTKEDYPNLNRKERKRRETERLGTISADAQLIKYADIIDNSVDITDNDPGFARKYIPEAGEILQKMDRGNPELRKRAIETVEACRTKLR